MYLSHHRVVLATAAAALCLGACAGEDALRSSAQRARADLLDTDGVFAPSRSDAQTTVLLLDPTQSGQYSLGNGNKLYVRAGGLCDLDSEYGPGTWDLPCKLADQPILIVARTWYDSAAHPHVDFWPALRFTPRSDSSSAELWLKDNAAANDSSAVIRYCNADMCRDESADDRSLATLHDRAQGFVFRRIKHFSGYQVATGRDGEPADTTGGGGQ